jgi:hypothetical protein
MSDLMKVGSDWGLPGTFKPFTSGVSGAQRVTDAHARYLDAVMAGRVFYGTVAGGAATAYTGGAAGTPFIGVHNPANSNKLLVLLGVSVASRVAASAAGTVGFNVWAGPSVLPTGTVTPATNALSLAASGSASRLFLNTALTGSTALALALPLGSYYWATAAGAIIAPTFFDVAGLVVAAPGNQFTFGGTAALTSATYDVAAYWEEIPFMPTV